jgi:hypothetical protein
MRKTDKPKGKTAKPKPPAGPAADFRRKATAAIFSIAKGASHGDALAAAGLRPFDFFGGLQKHSDLDADYKHALDARAEWWTIIESETLHDLAMGNVPIPELTHKGEIVYLKRANIQALLRLFDQHNPKPKPSEIDDAAFIAFQCALGLRDAARGKGASK